MVMAQANARSGAGRVPRGLLLGALEGAVYFTVKGPAVRAATVALDRIFFGGGDFVQKYEVDLAMNVLLMGAAKLFVELLPLQGLVYCSSTTLAELLWMMLGALISIAVYAAVTVGTNNKRKSSFYGVSK